LQLHEDDQVTISDSAAASVPSSGRNTPAQLSDVVIAITCWIRDRV